MKPTRIPVLVLTVVLFGAAGYLLAATAYAVLPPLPPAAPVGQLVLAVVEVALARLVRQRVRGTGGGRPQGRPLHPLQVARAAVLAKASALAGAVLTGLDAGVFGWVFPRRAHLVTYTADARVAGLAALTSLALVVAALLLERACRVPEPPDGPTLAR